MPKQPLAPLEFASPTLRLRLARRDTASGPVYNIEEIALRAETGWQTLLTGITGEEFVTSLGACAADTLAVDHQTDGSIHVTLSGATDGWSAEETLTLSANTPVITRTQRYTFHRDLTAAVRPGFRLEDAPEVRYTYPLFAHAQPLSQAPAARASVDWALPLPCHLWSGPGWVAVYGVDRVTSLGTLEFTPPADGSARLGIYYPDTATAPDGGFPGQPETAEFHTGDTLTLTEFISAAPVSDDNEPFYQGIQLAAVVLLREAAAPADLIATADGIADFYPRCELWHPDALGPGRGWFSNMWVRTQTGPAKKQGEMSGYFDLGWGEGIAVEAMLGIVRHWRRTGRADLLPYVDEMSRNIDCFKRGEGDAAPYFDRSDGTRYGDFLMDHVPGSRIWTHALGHTASQLLLLYQEFPDYPNTAARDAWLHAAASMARFLAAQQRPDGDLPDIFDDANREANHKPHRITARAVVCGVWTRYGEITGDLTWRDRALTLATAVGPEIARDEYYNQMLDGIISPVNEYVDGEAAWYVLEGLAPLYRVTQNTEVLRLCRQAATFGIMWTYFFNLPTAHHGIARGGQCCRMPDTPLLYPIGPAKAITPLLGLADATADPFPRAMAAEMVTFIGHYAMPAPGTPWHGGMIHALGQFNNKHWGPDLAGQIDSGMATGNSLAALEAWLREKSLE